MKNFNIGDMVASNVDGVFYNKNAVAVVLATGVRTMTVRFSTGVKGCVSATQIVTVENFRFIPTGEL